jgi:signal transduction histidine kinase
MVVFSLENFQDSLKEHNLDPRDNIIIVDRNGDVISSNDLTAVNRNTNLSTYTPVQKVIRGESGVAAHNDAWDGQPRVSAYSPISGSGWGVIVSTPLSLEYKPLYDQMIWILGILLFFIVAFSIFGYFASKYLTDPIVKLSGTMNRISAGDHDVRVQVERRDEIGVLARTFNSMMDSLEEAKSRSDMYLDLMGHDINNMNQVALGYLELADNLIESGDTIGKSREALIKKPIGALEDSFNLIDNVRKLQRASTEALLTSTVDLNKTLSELADQYSHIPGRDIKIDFERAGEHLVRANELIKDVFSNLIWNAIKHSDPGKPLAIRLSVDEKTYDGKKYYEVSVEDNGPGIKDELKDRLFSRFSRGETKAKGSGLGLYLVKTLVDGFHGRVRVEDSVLGDHTKGAKFVVMLPAAAQV